MTYRCEESFLNFVDLYLQICTADLLQAVFQTSKEYQQVHKTEKIYLYELQALVGFQTNYSSTE